MTTLVLVRHAKSDWGSPSQDDHERPLNARGMRDAPASAERLAATGIRLDAVLSSTAVRARTALLAAAAGRGVDAVMVVAHDPGAP